MESNYPKAILANFNGDYRAAYEHLAKAYFGLETQLCDSTASRFIEISKVEDNPVCIQKVTEEHISRAVDMADCGVDYEMRKWFYLDDAGNLQPVTIGKQERINTGEENPGKRSETWSTPITKDSRGGNALPTS